MTSKERVLTAIDHREPDRVPIHVYLTPEIQRKLMDHFGFDNAMRLYETFGVDFRTVGAPFTGTLPPKPDCCDIVDEWGVGYKMFDHGHGGAYPEAHCLTLRNIATMEEFEAYPWPDPDNYDYTVVEARCDAVADYAVCIGGAGIPDILNGVSRGRGMEQVMMEIMMQDPVGVAIIDKRCDFYHEQMRRTLEAAKGKVDILCLGEDCGNQGGRMFPREVFDEFFHPRLKRFYDLAHEFGCKAMMHSCGDTHDIIPTFIDMGLDVLDAMQPEPPGMVVEDLKRNFGDRITFCGLISTQQTLPFGTVEECREEARHRLDVVAKGGGYIFAPAHCIQADNPVENVLAAYEVALGLEPRAFGRPPHVAA